MTYGELFREVAHELGLPINPETEKIADTICPGIINQQVPPERFQELKAICRAKAAETLALSDAEQQKIVHDYLSKN